MGKGYRPGIGKELGQGIFQQAPNARPGLGTDQDLQSVSRSNCAQHETSAFGVGHFPGARKPERRIQYGNSEALVRAGVEGPEVPPSSVLLRAVLLEAQDLAAPPPQSLRLPLVLH